MEQTISGDKYFNVIKETSDSINLLKLIENVYYNYHSHEFSPLYDLEAID